MELNIGRKLRPRASAFTLVEVLISSALLGGVMATFYTGIAFGFSLIDATREDLRASQLLIEKMETIRLYSWDQINSNGFIPPTFTAPFSPLLSGNTNVSSGIAYYGSLSITNAQVDSAYSAHLKSVHVSLTWTNQGMPHRRDMETMVSEFGMQNYVY